MNERIYHLKDKEEKEEMARKKEKEGMERKK
jgi:hypothetical protein